MVEFLKLNVVSVLGILIAILTLIVMCLIYKKEKIDKETRDEKKFREDIKERLARLEERMNMLFTIYPQLKALEKLENFDKLKLSEEDIKKTIAEILKTTGVTPEIIETRIGEKVKERFSEFDKNVADVVARKLNEANRVFKKNIGTTSDYLKLGNVEHEKGEYSKAIEYYDKALELKPDDAMAWYNKGVTFGKIERYDEALKAYDKTIELKPDNTKAWYNRSCAFAMKNDKSNALGNLSKAITLDGKYKEKAKTDTDFKNLWEDEGFKKIVS